MNAVTIVLIVYAVLVGICSKLAILAGDTSFAIVYAAFALILLATAIWECSMNRRRR